MNLKKDNKTKKCLLCACWERSDWNIKETLFFWEIYVIIGEFPSSKDTHAINNRKWIICNLLYIQLNKHKNSINLYIKANFLQLCAHISNLIYK